MSRIVLVAAALSIGSVAFAQSVTTTSLAIGGIDALGCASTPANPPTLEGGVAASGQCVFVYDALTQILTLTVTNTSLIVPTEPNPVITRIFVNLPQLAVSGATLISQTAAIGTPNFTLAVDTDVTDATNSLVAGCFGNFGMRLQHGPGLNGSIANANAEFIPGAPNTMVIGPAVFQIQIIGNSEATSSLIAQAFAHSWSVNPMGLIANAAFSFGGGINFAEGFLGNTPVGQGGAPAGWISGTPEAGETITVVQSGTPGWEGCMVAATSPGPIVIGGIVFPIGPDWFPIFGGIIPPVGFLSQTIVIPEEIPGPEIGSITFFAIVALASPDQRIITVSDTIMLEIDF